MGSGAQRQHASKARKSSWIRASIKAGTHIQQQKYRPITEGPSFEGAGSISSATQLAKVTLK